MKLRRLVTEGSSAGLWLSEDGHWQLVRPTPLGVVADSSIRQERFWRIGPGSAGFPWNFDLLRQNGLWQVRFPTRKAALVALELMLGKESSE